jgi:hypothetical protein
MKGTGSARRMSRFPGGQVPVGHPTHKGASATVPAAESRAHSNNLKPAPSGMHTEHSAASSASTEKNYGASTSYADKFRNVMTGGAQGLMNKLIGQ